MNKEQWTNLLDTYQDGTPKTTEEARRQQTEWDEWWANLSEAEQEEYLKGYEDKDE